MTSSDMKVLTVHLPVQTALADSVMSAIFLKISSEALAEASASVAEAADVPMQMLQDVVRI